MMKQWLQMLFIISMLVCISGIAHADLFIDTVDWNDDGIMHEREGIKLDGAGSDFVFDYTHEIEFIPPAATVDAATLTLSHYGNSGNGEIWLLTVDSLTQIGQLGTSNSNWLDEDFTIPTALLSSISGDSWSLEIRLEETTNGTDNLWLDQSVLQGTFTPVPVPAAGWFLGSGLIGLVGFRKRKHKSDS